MQLHDILQLRTSVILPEAISDGGLAPTTDTSLFLTTYRGGSHLPSDILQEADTDFYQIWKKNIKCLKIKNKEINYEIFYCLFILLLIMFYCFWIDNWCVWLFYLWTVYRGFHTGRNRIYHRFCYSYSYSFNFWYEEVNYYLMIKSGREHESCVIHDLAYWYLCVNPWFKRI